MPTAYEGGFNTYINMNNTDYELLFVDTFTAITCNVPVCGVFKLSSKNPSAILYSIAENDRDISVYINDKRNGIRLIDTITMNVQTPLHYRTLENIRHFVSSGNVSVETFTYRM